MYERILKEKKNCMLDYIFLWIIFYLHQFIGVFVFLVKDIFLRRMKSLFGIDSECFICAYLFRVRLLFHHVSAHDFIYPRMFWCPK